MLLKYTFGQTWFVTCYSHTKNIEVASEHPIFRPITSAYDATRSILSCITLISDFRGDI